MKTTVIDKCFGNVMTATSSEWRADRLISVKHYAGIEGQPYSFYAFRRVELTDPRCRFWAASNGECFGLAPLRPSCIASAESALRPFGPAYVTFRSSKPTPATAKRWADKWSKRTARSS